MKSFFSVFLIIILSFLLVPPNFSRDRFLHIYILYDQPAKVYGDLYLETCYEKYMDIVYSNVKPFVQPCPTCNEHSVSV